MHNLTLGIDVGGTFTDIVCWGDHGTTSAKVPSVPESQEQGVLAGVAEIAKQLNLSVEAALHQTGIIVHGTTVGTNTMLQFNGARTYMLTTAGVRDVIELRRNYKEGAFTLTLPAPVPIIPRRRRIPVEERLDYRGRVVLPLIEASLDPIVEQLREESAESVAICYLHSYANPVHELLTEKVLRAGLPDIHISPSHKVFSKIREFERFSTTAVDAYTTPVLSTYLSRLQDQLIELGFRGDLLIMRSNGGVVEVERAKEEGVRLLFSGPAAGVVASAHVGAQAEVSNMITMDMGGTSCDVCLIQDGKPRVGEDSWVNRYRVSVPVIDVTTIGAGGGSIAWVDEGGALRIGPQSAGALPGPASYDMGGTCPTVTDADLVLGFLDSSRFLGGVMNLRADLASKAIETHVAKPLSMSIENAAFSIYQIVNNNMANAVREVSLAKGYDPRDFALMAFGGAGPVHASALVAELGINRLLIPRDHAPVFCALGDVLCDVRETVIGSTYVRGSTIDLAELQRRFTKLLNLGEASVGQYAQQYPGTISRWVEMRYRGQTHEVVVPFSDPEEGPITKEHWTATLDRFHALHKEHFTFNNPDAETEVIGIRLERWAHRPKPELTSDQKGVKILGVDSRQVYLGSQIGWTETPVYQGADIVAGYELDGPCIIDESNTSIVILPNQRAKLDKHSLYIVEVTT